MSNTHIVQNTMPVEEAENRLRETLSEGQRFYTCIRSIPRTNMYAWATFHVVESGRIVDITNPVAALLRLRRNKERHAQISVVGMDRGFAIADLIRQKIGITVDDQYV